MPALSAISPDPTTGADGLGAPSLWPAGNPAALAELAAACGQCQRCGLAESRQQVVVGRGNPHARLLLIGEAPGAEEDASGQPFVGRAGKLLEQLLAEAGLDSERDLSIANVIKCRPPGNRVPAAAEVAACEPYLHRQIQLLQPKVIVALGKTAAVTLLGKEQSIASMRGKVFRYRDTPLMVTYHPAYLLRTLPDKIKAWEDLCFIRERVAEWRAGAAQDAQPPG